SMKQIDVPIWERYTLTIEEAAKYFRIGENKLRRLAEENKHESWLIMHGNRVQIKRKQFEKVIDKLDVIESFKGLLYDMIVLSLIKAISIKGKEQLSCQKKDGTTKVES